jgi:phage/plasmid-associated DNA primase
MREVKRKVISEGTFKTERTRASEEGVGKSAKHPRETFICDMVVTLEKKEHVEKLIKESQIFMEKEATFDMNPDLFQLDNCVLDLITNSFRAGRPSDMTMRASAIRIPPEWLEDKSLISQQSFEQRKLAWSIVWSIYVGQGMVHPHDHFEELGNRDAENFHYLMNLFALLLEGRPTQKCPLFFSPRGRNSKGIIEKMFMAVWGTYYLPVKSTIFQADKRNEN